MFQRLQQAGRRLSSVFTEDDFVISSFAANLIKVGGQWRNEKVPDVNGFAFNAALANAATQIIYTVTAGKFPVLYTMLLSASVGAQMQIRYNSVVFAQIIIPAGSTIVIQPPKGHVFPTTGNNFDAVNLSGGAIAFGGAVMLSEY